MQEHNKVLDSKERELADRLERLKRIFFFNFMFSVEISLFHLVQ